MKLVKEHINEKFTEDSDPIQDMGIGIIKKIKEWIEDLNIKSGDQYGIKNYEINDDGTIDIMSESSIPDSFGNLPVYIEFRNAHGNFHINNCNLKTLRGCPKNVYGDFNCNTNSLTSLEYAPTFVEGDFLCYNNSVNFSKKDVKKVCKVKGEIFVNW